MLEKNCIHVAQASVDLYIQLDTTSKLIDKTRFKAYGSPYIIAGMEWLCRQIEGKNIAALQSLDIQQIMDILGIPPTRHAEAIQLQTIHERAMSALKRGYKHE